MNFLENTVNFVCRAVGAVSDGAAYTSYEGAASTAQAVTAPVASAAGDDIRGVLWPTNGKTVDFRFERKQANFLTQHPDANHFKLETSDSEKLDAVWIEGTQASKDEQNSNSSDRPTAVIFHGNAMVLYDMTHVAQFYKQRGMNVLMVTFRGYQGSTGDAWKSGERGTLLDVDAAMRHVLQEKGVRASNVIAHGFSLGGAYAATAAHHYGVHLTLDHTFTSPPEVSVPLPTAIKEGAFRNILPDSGVDPVSTFDGREIHVDGLNTARKLADMQGELFVAYGSQDKIMPTDLGEKLYAARYGKNNDQHKEAHTAFHENGKCAKHTPFLTEQDCEQEEFLRKMYHQNEPDSSENNGYHNMSLGERYSEFLDDLFKKEDDLTTNRTESTRLGDFIKV